MRPTSHRPAAFRRFSALLIVAQLGACASWHTQAATPEQVLARKAPDRVRLTLDDRRVVVLQPRVVDDSLRGTSVIRDGRHRVETPVAVRLRDIRRTETHGFNTGRTVALTLGSLALAAGIAVFWALGEAISASD
jgi:hypothetical protein